MALSANLVHEISTSSGTGPNMTVSAVRRRGSTAFGTGDNGANNPIMFIHNRDVPTEYEIVPCYWSDADTMVRGTPIESSNSNNAVNFSAGTKDVTNGILASGATTSVAGVSEFATDA